MSTTNPACLTGARIPDPSVTEFSSDLDNVSKGPANLGAIEHQLTIQREKPPDKVPTRESLICTFTPVGTISKSSPQQQTHV